MTNAQLLGWEHTHTSEQIQAMHAIFGKIEDTFQEQPDLNDTETYLEIAHAAIIVLDNQFTN